MRRGTWSSESFSGMGPKCPSIRSFCSTFRELTQTRASSYTTSLSDCSSRFSTPSTCTQTHTHTWAINKIPCRFSLLPPSRSSSYLHILQVFDISRVVSIPLAVLNDFKPPPANCVNHRTAIREKLDVSNLQQTTVVGKPAGKERAGQACCANQTLEVPAAAVALTLWGRLLDTCRNSSFPSPYTVGSSVGSRVRRYEEGTEQSGRPWCTQR